MNVAISDKEYRGLIAEAHYAAICPRCFGGLLVKKRDDGQYWHVAPHPDSVPCWASAIRELEDRVAQTVASEQAQSDT